MTITLDIPITQPSSRVITHELMVSWINALRSGEYTQGKKRLRGMDDTFCVMGVLTDLLVKQGHGQWIPLRNHYLFSWGSISSGGVLDPERLNHPVITYLTTQLGILGMNDRGVDFDTLADHIEVAYADYQRNNR